MPATMTTTSAAAAPNIVVPHENALMSNSPMDEPLTIAVMDCPGTVCDRLLAACGRLAASEESWSLIWEPNR
jgi:hypothetical protein